MSNAFGHAFCRPYVSQCAVADIQLIRHIALSAKHIVQHLLKNMDGDSDFCDSIRLLLICG